MAKTIECRCDRCDRCDRCEWNASHRSHRHKPTTRRLAQLYAALLYNANLKGFIEGRIFVGDTKAICVPGLNCYSCPAAIGACPLGALQNALNAADHTAPWYVLGILCLYGVILGRTICGWLCPMGLIQELLHKIPTPKVKKSAVTRALSYLKYVVLVVFAVAIPIWYGVRHGKTLPGFCKYICPAGTLEGAVGLLANPRNATSFFQLKLLFTRKVVIMLAAGLTCVFIYRAFCRFLCPLGAIYGLFNRFAITGVKVNRDRCNNCGACVRNCKMDVRHVGDHECISCGQCIGHCAQGAIAMKCGKYTWIGPETGRTGRTGKNADAPVAPVAPVAPEAIAKRKRTGRIFWGVAVVALVGILIWLNVVNPPKLAEAQAPAPTVEPVATAEPAPVETVTEEPAPVETVEDYTSDAPIGADVGNQLADFTTELLGGGEFHLADHRGQVVFINLWATYCPPCVEELPFFDQLAAEHPDDLVILAIHHRTGAKKAAGYLEDKGWNHLNFANDSKDKGLFDIVNGSEAMPQTIVLNRKGEVIYNVQSPVSDEQLAALYEKAGQE